MTTATYLPLALFLFMLVGCVHNINMQSKDGEKWKGKYRFARDDSGLVQMIGASGEVLTGKFHRVGRPTFVEGYKNTFGSDSITTQGPDISAYGNAFGGGIASSRSLADSAQGARLQDGPGDAKLIVTGPLFYWTASLHGDRGTSMGCYFVGSSYTGRGFGRCKSHTGKEYGAEF